MDVGANLLSEITIYSKYSRYLPELKRRESWDELVTRNMMMHIKKYPDLAEEIYKNYQFVYDKKVLPSMRSLQFGGKPIELNPTRIFNCAFLPMDNWFAFPEVMFLLLGGTGVGFSVQKHHVDKLPHIQKPISRKRRHLIGDSIEGWADSIKILMKSYFFGLSNPEFDFSAIRPKGSPLKTAGGKAPGPEPLKDCIHNIKRILDRKQSGEKLSSIEVHDICCYIADAVLSGGIRRSAMVSLFSFDDEEMITAKYGNWFLENPQRSRANNSAVILRHRINKKQFLDFWKRIELSGCGEPGFLFSNNSEVGSNPCLEVSLKSFQFCNLCEINAGSIESQEDFNNRAKAAAFIGTLQAGYTDFHYLRDVWKETTEKDALLGIGLTGIASESFLKLNLNEAAECANVENERVSSLIGINKASRVTVVKPSGTTSCVLGTSSGIHAWHDQYYIRRIIVNKEENLYKFVKEQFPNLIEDSFSKPNLEAILSIPIKAPKESILRTNESPIDLLERVKKLNEGWIKPGHRTGDNTNNVSCTVSVKPDEYKEVGEWMWKNKDFYNGLSIIPFDGGTYVQTPFESCTKYMYDKLFQELKEVDLTQVIEEEDQTSAREEAACANGKCEI